MNIPDRKQAPEFKNIGITKLFQPKKTLLKNEIPLFVFNLLEADLVKFEMIFSYQEWDDSKPLSNLLNRSAAAKLMDDGTHKKTSAQIASEIDFYGSYYQVNVQADYVSVELFALRKYLANNLPVLFEILNEAIFPEEEIKIFKTNNIQRIQVDDQKVQKLSSKLFYKSIFGSNSSYGYAENIRDYELLKREGLLKAYASLFYARNCTIIVSGKVEEKDIKTIDDVFGNYDWGFGQGRVGWVAKESADRLSMNKSVDNSIIKAENIFQDMENANQSAIKMGKKIIHKSHPDFPKLQLLNTVLGGYFGSRLMSNIREEKGYTYGIGSSVHSLKVSGYFIISTEVNSEYTQATIQEIYKEIEVLHKIPISNEELSLVKNFMRGSFLSSLENVFSYADKFKSIYFQGLDYTYYDRFFNTLENCHAKELLEISNEYLQKESFHRVIVGKE